MDWFNPIYLWENLWENLWFPVKIFPQKPIHWIGSKWPKFFRISMEMRQQALWFTKKKGYHKGRLWASPCSYFGSQISRLVESPVRHFFTRFFHIAHEKLSWDISPRHFREIFPAIPSPEYHLLNPHNLLRPAKKQSYSIFPCEYSTLFNINIMNSSCFRPICVWKWGNPKSSGLSHFPNDGYMSRVISHETYPFYHISQLFIF